MKGFVAYFDILGFSELLRSQEADAFEEKFEKYCEILNDATSREERDLDYTFFSDSVIINTKGDELTQLLNIAKAISEITYRLTMELDVAICGCISFGTFTKRRDNGNAMMTGTPILEAIHYENQQNWVGTMLSPSVLIKYRELRDILSMNPLGPNAVGVYCKNISWLTAIQKYRDIPFPNGSYEGYVIVPRNRKSVRIGNIQKDYLLYRNKLRELLLLAPDDYAQYKYDKSCSLIVKISNLWGPIVSNPTFKRLHYLDIE